MRSLAVALFVLASCASATPHTATTVAAPAAVSVPDALRPAASAVTDGSRRSAATAIDPRYPWPPTTTIFMREAPVAAPITDLRGVRRAGDPTHAGALRKLRLGALARRRPHLREDARRGHRRGGGLR